MKMKTLRQINETERGTHTWVNIQVQRQMCALLCLLFREKVISYPGWPWQEVQIIHLRMYIKQCRNEVACLHWFAL